eukprot:PhF_6_TR7908/c0_g1_i1/m.11755
MVMDCTSMFYRDSLKILTCDPTFRDAFTKPFPGGVSYLFYILTSPSVHSSFKQVLVEDLIKDAPTLVELNAAHPMGTLVHFVVRNGWVSFLQQHLLENARCDLNVATTETPVVLEMLLQMVGKTTNQITDGQITEMVEMLILTGRVDQKLITLDAYTAVSRLKQPRLYYLLWNHRFPMKKFALGDTFLHMVARVPYETPSQIAPTLTFVQENLGLDLNCLSTDSRKGSALMTACESGNYVMIRELLVNNVRPDLKNSMDENALLLLLRYVQDDEIIQKSASLLLMKNAYMQVHQKCADSRGGKAPIHYACERGLITLIEMAYDRGGHIDVNLTDSKGNTVLAMFLERFVKHEDRTVNIVRRIASGKVSLTKGAKSLMGLITKHPCLSIACAALQATIMEQNLVHLVTSLHEMIDEVTPFPFYLIQRATPTLSVEDKKHLTNMLLAILNSQAVKPNLTHDGVAILTACAERGLVDVVDKLLAMGANPNNRTSLCLLAVLNKFIEKEIAVGAEGDEEGEGKAKSATFLEPDALALAAKAPQYEPQYPSSALSMTAIHIIMDSKFVMSTYPYLETFLDLKWKEDTKEDMMSVFRNLLKFYSPKHDALNAMTPLHYLIQNDLPNDMKIPYLQCFLQNDQIDLNATFCPNSETPLCMALRLSLWEIAVQIAANPRCDISKGNPLHRAILADRQKKATSILIHFVNVVADRGNVFAEEGGATVFTLAIERGDAALMTAVMDAGVGPRDRFEASRAITHMIYMNEKESIVCELAERMKHHLPGAPEDQGVKVFQTAAAHGYRSVCRLLVLQGFRPCHEAVCDTNGLTPLHHAFEYSGPDKEEMFLEMITLTTRPRDLQLWVPDKAGRTLLMRAAIEGEYGVMMELIKRGATLEAADSTGTTALLYALENDNAETFCFPLLNSTTVRYQRPSDGITPLHLACKKLFPECVKMMLEAGAPIDVADNHDNLPVHTCLAKKGGSAAKEKTLDVLFAQHKKLRAAHLFQAKSLNDLNDIESASLLITLLAPTKAAAIPWLELRVPDFTSPYVDDQVKERVLKYGKVVNRVVELPNVSLINSMAHSLSNKATQMSVIQPFTVEFFTKILVGCDTDVLLGGSTLLAHTFFFPYLAAHMTLTHDVELYAYKHENSVNNLTAVIGVILYKQLGAKLTHEFLTTKAPPHDFDALVETVMAASIFGAPQWMFASLAQHVTVWPVTLRRVVMMYGHAQLVASYLKLPEAMETAVQLFFVRPKNEQSGEKAIDVFRVLLDFRVPLDSPKAVEYIQDNNLTKFVNILGDTVIHLAAMSNQVAMLDMDPSRLPDSSAENCFHRVPVDYCVSVEMEEKVKSLERKAVRAKAVETLREVYTLRPGEKAVMIPKPPLSRRTRTCTTKQ